MTNLDELMEKVDAISKSYWEMLDKLEVRIDEIDPILAALVAGYAELAANVQAILEIMLKSSPEDTADLVKALEDQRNLVVETLSQASRNPVEPNKEDGDDNINES